MARISAAFGVPGLLRRRVRHCAVGPAAYASLMMVIVAAAGLASASRPAVASVPHPREEGDTKSGRNRPIEEMSREQRIVSLPKDQPFPDYLKFGSTWQEPVACGPNALFVLLRLCGLNVTRDHVLKLVPVTDRGATLADISQAATALGLRHRVKKVSQNELFRLQPPILVHETVRSTDSGDRDSGHFFVIVRFFENGQVGVVDSVSGMYQLQGADRFDRSFSGYVLVPELTVLGIPTRWMWVLMYAMAAVVVALAVALPYVSRPVAAQPADLNEPDAAQPAEAH